MDILFPSEGAGPGREHGIVGAAGLDGKTGGHQIIGRLLELDDVALLSYPLEQRRFFGPLDILVLQHRHLGDLALIGDLIAPKDSIRRDGVGDTIPQGFDAQHPVLVSLCMGSDGKKHLRQIGPPGSDRQPSI